MIMGIAIHIVIEVQQENGEWLAITDDTWAPRDWKLFTAITFGDDGGGSNIPYPPRGLPEDHSVGVRNCYFFPAEKGVQILSEWAHGTSWLTLEELDVAMDCGGVTKEGRSKEFLKLFSKMTRVAKKSGKDRVRMVFWFSP